MEYSDSELHRYPWILNLNYNFNNKLLITFYEVNFMKNPILAGMIAGFFGGVGATTAKITATLIALGGFPISRLYVEVPASSFLNAPFLMTHVTFEVFIHLVFGTLFGLLYSKLYDWLCVLDAMEGNWDSAINRLLSHIDFEKKVLKNTRVLIINLVAKRVMQHSLWILTNLLNQPDCPREVYHKILDRLKPITVSEVGTQIALKADYLALSDALQKRNYSEGDTILGKFLSALFFQKELLMRQTLPMHVLECPPARVISDSTINVYCLVF